MRKPDRWALAVAAAVFIAFVCVLRHQFVSWDDDGFLYLNFHFRGLGWTQLRWMFTTFLKGPYQPIVWMSYALDYLLWGMDPAGFHLTNLLWHCANAALLFVFSRRLFQAAAPGTAEAPRCWAAAGAALIFALHPLRVEPVAWAAARRDLMCGFFFLCALLCHLKGREEPARERFWRGATVACYCLCLLSKAMGIGLPLVLAVLDSTILRRRVRWSDLLPYAVPAALAAALAWYGQAVTGALAAGAGFGWQRRLAQACYGHAFYLVRTLWPSGLAPMYGTALNIDPLAPRFLASAALDLAVAGSAFALRRRWPALWAAWLCYLLLLAPVLGAVKFGLQLVADRYSYLPCLSVSLLAAAGLLELARRRPGQGRPLILCGTALVSLLWGLCAQQLYYWRDSETLYFRILDVDPGQAMARNNLGLVYAGQGRGADAVEQFHLALKLRPRFAAAHNNLGSAMLKLGRLQEAEAEFRAAMASDPGLAESYNNIGLLLAHRKRYDEALAMFDTALSLNPDSGLTAQNRALCLRQKQAMAR
ncbi:MAG: tetratricopeptide repeat protein [Elusimicrobia bacterium]|nr:tetratricopeptide repeat protein [Elusimicrobiota bacterium]